MKTTNTFFIVKHDVEFNWRDVQHGMPRQLPLEEIKIHGKDQNNGRKTIGGPLFGGKLVYYTWVIALLNLTKNISISYSKPSQIDYKKKIVFENITSWCNANIYLFYYSLLNVYLIEYAIFVVDIHKTPIIELTDVDKYHANKLKNISLYPSTFFHDHCSLCHSSHRRISLARTHFHISTT